MLFRSVVLLGSAAAQFFVGALADRYGRRPVLTVAIVLFLGASVGLGLSRSLPQVLLFRFLQGATAAAGPILARAIVRDVYERHAGAHVLSLLATGLALIPLCVPSLNAVTVAQYGWRATAVHEAANVAEDASRRFLIDPQAQFDLMRGLRGTERRLIGCYHSHPDGEAKPSATDGAHAYEAGFLYVIAAGSPGIGFTLGCFLSGEAGDFVEIALS